MSWKRLLTVDPLEMAGGSVKNGRLLTRDQPEMASAARNSWWTFRNGRLLTGDPSERAGSGLKGCDDWKEKGRAVDSC